MFRLKNEEALELLVNRVEYWTNDDGVLKLFKKMYESYLANDVFNYQEHSINDVVDNDYVNYCSVVILDDFEKEDAKKLVELFKNGDRDISCEDLGYSYVEAVDDEENPSLFLMRR